MKVYFSTFEVLAEFREKRKIERITNIIAESIINSGNILIWDKDFINYNIITQKIESSDLFIAMIDEMWMSSTWKAIELWFALGKSPESSNNTLIKKPIKTYVYLEPKNIIDHWKKTLVDINVLPKDESSLLKKLNSLLIEK